MLGVVEGSLDVADFRKRDDYTSLLQFTSHRVPLTIPYE